MIKVLEIVMVNLVFMNEIEKIYINLFLLLLVFRVKYPEILNWKILVKISLI